MTPHSICSVWLSTNILPKKAEVSPPSDKYGKHDESYIKLIRINERINENFSPHLGVLKCGVMGIMRFDHRRLPRHRLHLDLRSMQQRRPFHPFQC